MGKTNHPSYLLYLGSPHDPLGFEVEVVISPQSLEQHVRADAHLLAVELRKLMNAAHKSI